MAEDNNETIRDFGEYDINKLSRANKKQEKKKPQPSDLNMPGAIGEDFNNFFTNFKIGSNYPYVEQVKDLPQRKDKTLLVRHFDLPDNLQDCIFKDAKVEDNLEVMEDAVRDIYKQYHPGAPESELNTIHARLTIDDPQLITTLRDINIELHRSLIVFNCMVVSQTENKPALRKKYYKCRNCGYIYNHKRQFCIQEYCMVNHKGAKSVMFSMLDSKFVDYQILEVQERQDDTDSTSVPKQLTVKVYGDIVNKFKAGDNVQIVGFVKLEKSVTEAQIKNMEQNDDFSNDLVFDLVVEAHNIQLLSHTSNLVIDDPTKVLRPEDIKIIHDIRAKLTDDQLLEKLRSCFAYWVHGNEEVKDLFLLQRAGSIHVKLGKHATKRKEINILLVGDPGVVKTVLLNAAVALSTKGIYTSGKGSSGVGLTASIDTTAKGLNKLKIGAVVLSNDSMCALDEFSEIGAENQGHLLECMESGTIHMNKNGINVVLNARTSISGALNPDKGKFDPNQSLWDNVTMSPQIWSRWDVVTVIRDIINMEKDGKIVDHILSLYEPGEEYNRPLDDEFLYKWMLYVDTLSDNIKITPAAKKVIKSFYNEIRRPLRDTDVTATPRQLEAIIRLCFACARLLLKHAVDEDLAIRIVNKLSYHYQTTGLINPQSGGMVQTAQYSKPLNKMKPKMAMLEIIRVLTDDNTKEIDRYDVVVELMQKADLSQNDAMELVTKAIDKGEVIITRGDFIKLSV